MKRDELNKCQFCGAVFAYDEQHNGFRHFECVTFVIGSGSDDWFQSGECKARVLKGLLLRVLSEYETSRWIPLDLLLQVMKEVRQ